MQERAAAIWDDQSVQGFLIAELIGDRAALEEKHGSLTNLYLSIYGGKEEEKHVEAAEV